MQNEVIRLSHEAFRALRSSLEKVGANHTLLHNTKEPTLVVGDEIFVCNTSYSTFGNGFLDSVQTCEKILDRPLTRTEKREILSWGMVNDLSTDQIFDMFLSLPYVVRLKVLNTNVGNLDPEDAFLVNCMKAAFEDYLSTL